MKQKAIVFDIDGVLLQTDFILREIEELQLYGDLKWDYFYNHCNSDRIEVIPQMKDILKSLSDEYFIILCTARNVKNWKQTSEKLRKENLWLYIKHIYMRAEDDFRQDVEVKHDLLKQIQDNYDIIAFIDDSLANCEMAKELGITALRVV